MKLYMMRHGETAWNADNRILGSTDIPLNAKGREQAREAAERLLTYKNPVIIMHAHPDGDTTGSASALIKILRQLGADAEYASADSIPKRLEFVLSGEKSLVKRAKRIFVGKILVL